MSQDHEHVPRSEGEHAPEREGQAGDIFSFHEVTYPSPPMNRWLQYFIGIAIGAIPLVAALLTLGSLNTGIDAGVLWSIAGYGYLTLIVASIVCLCISRIRKAIRNARTGSFL